MGDVGFAPRAARDVRLAAFAVGEALMVDEAFAPFTVGEAPAPFTVDEAPTPSAVDDMSVGAFARASGGTSRNTPATAARFSSSPTVE